MKIANIRLGFATNSSSSHSVVILPNQRDDRVHDDNYYGWENFVLASKEEKMKYLDAQIACHYSDNCKIDHQSVWSFPADIRARVAYIKCLKALLERDDVVILGGNDNGEEHYLYSADKEIPILKDIRKDAIKLGENEKKFTFIAPGWAVEQVTKTELDYDDYQYMYEIEIDFSNVIPEYKVLRRMVRI